MQKLVLFIILSVFLFSCSATTKEERKVKQEKIFTGNYHPDKYFADYWYGNNAEITRYELKQGRYGEMRDGEAVLIFVTEDVDLDTRVKSNVQTKNSVPVLKLNQMRKFYTGVYPYSIMLTVLQPVAIPLEFPLRVSFSSQEWCGHLFSMLEPRDGQMKITMHSYFDNEEDYVVYQPSAWTEDAVFNQIRINPDNLPVGDMKMYPSSMHSRFSHKKVEPYAAIANWLPETDDLRGYQINFPQEGRELRVWFSSEFPYTIEKWEEDFKSGFGSHKKTLTTSAVMKKRVRSPYWNQNALKDSVYKKELGLKF